MPSSSPQQPSNLLKECWWETWVKIKYQVQASPLQPLLFFLMFTSITFLCTSKFWLGLEVKRPKCQEGGKGLSLPGFSKGTGKHEDVLRWQLMHVFSCRANHQGGFHGPRPPSVQGNWLHRIKHCFHFRDYFSEGLLPPAVNWILGAGHPGQIPTLETPPLRASRRQMDEEATFQKQPKVFSHK